ncbi:MAG: hypothetical protein L6Q57_09085 [Alphaproteobacteria bacterium]|nr:hypothetical protein [Alphaproteobacteria bacterium]
MSIPESRCGVVTYATNKPLYVQQAVALARSIKAHAPDLPVALFTNLQAEAQAWGQGVFDRIIPYACVHQPAGELAFMDKLKVMAQAPFENTLYLDSDMHVFCDVRDVFALLQRFQIVVTHGHNRRVRDLAARGLYPDQKGRTRKIIDAMLPESFSPIQGGFLLYRLSDPAVRTWFETLIARYKDNDFYDDQVAIRQTLWEDAQLSLYVLPEEYNFTGLSAFRQWQRAGFHKAVPRILHYTEHKKNPFPAITRMGAYAHVVPAKGYWMRMCLWVKSLL